MPITALIVVSLLAQAPSAPAFDGRARQLDVAIPQIEAAVDVDGVLDEPVWARAATLTGFSQYAPVD